MLNVIGVPGAMWTGVPDVGRSNTCNGSCPSLPSVSQSMKENNCGVGQPIPRDGVRLISICKWLWIRNCFCVRDAGVCPLFLSVIEPQLVHTCAGLCILASVSVSSYVNWPYWFSGHSFLFLIIPFYLYLVGFFIWLVGCLLGWFCLVLVLFGFWFGFFCLIGWFFVDYLGFGVCFFAFCFCFAWMSVWGC